MADKDQNPSTGKPDQNNRQEASPGSSAGPYTGGPGAGSTRESGFVHASPESNVGPAGAPQTSHGFAGQPEPNRQSGQPGARADALPPGQSVQHADGGASSARSNDVEDDNGLGGSAGSESR